MTPLGVGCLPGLLAMLVARGWLLAASGRGLLRCGRLANWLQRETEAVKVKRPERGPLRLVPGIRAMETDAGCAAKPQVMALMSCQRDAETQ